MHKNIGNILPRSLDILIDDNAVQASAVLTSDNTNPDPGDLVTIGERIYVFTTALELAVKADALITSDTTAPDDGSTVTIGDVTYTFKTAMTGGTGDPNEVLIGVSVATALDNLKSAVNASAGEGSTYGTGTVANPDVTAGTNTDTTQALNAVVAGTDGNDLELSGTGTHHFTFTAFNNGIDSEQNDQVLIAGTADESLQNLVDLINDGREAVEATAVLTSDETNPDPGDNVVIGANTYEFVDALTEVKASGVLTSDETNVAEGASVTIGDILYRFTNNLSEWMPYWVKIGADADTSLANLVKAINGSSGASVNYGMGTEAHPDVVSSEVDTHAITVTAKVSGEDGNLIAKAETSAHLDWDGTGDVLSGGVDPVANEILIGEDADTTLANLVNAVNNGGDGVTSSRTTEVHPEVTAGDVDTHAVTFTSVDLNVLGNSLAKSEDSSHLDWDGTGALFTGGVEPLAPHELVRASDVSSHATTVTAIDGGLAGNAIAKAEDSAHLDWDGAGAVFTGGGSTIGTSQVGGEGGKMYRLSTVAPQLTGTPTYTIAITDADGNQKYLSSSQNENATVNTALEMMIDPTDIIKITTSAKVEETLPFAVNLS